MLEVLKNKFRLFFKSEKGCHTKGGVGEWVDLKVVKRTAYRL
jgi:hypothetical protein